MSRLALTLIKNATAAMSGEWLATGGHFNSVDAKLSSGATAAVINIYGSNVSEQDGGALLGTITLSEATPSDGFTQPPGETGWLFVRASVASTTGGVSHATACAGE